MIDLSATQRLEHTMRRVSAVISLIAVLLMGVGFIWTFVFGTLPPIPGDAALSPRRLVSFAHTSWGLWAMSAGIVLLALLPALRVLLAVVLFYYKQDYLDMGTGLVVLLELFVSMHMGGG